MTVGMQTSCTFCLGRMSIACIQVGSGIQRMLRMCVPSGKCPSAMFCWCPKFFCMCQQGSMPTSMLPSPVQEAMRKFRLRETGMHPNGAEPQSYGLGVKEVRAHVPCMSCSHDQGQHVTKSGKCAMGVQPNRARKAGVHMFRVSHLRQTLRTCGGGCDDGS